MNLPAVAAEDLEVLGPWLPLCRMLGRLAAGLAEGSSIDAVEVEFLGHLSEHDARPLGVAVLLGLLSGHTEEEVNQVNAPAIARERGIQLSETSRSQARDFTDLVRVTIVSGDDRDLVAGTLVGQQHRPHLLAAWGHRFNVQLEDHLALFRYRDVPGMIGRVGTCFGEHGINITSASVGFGETEGEAVMALTAVDPVPRAVVDELVAGEGFLAGRAVSLV